MNGNQSNEVKNPRNTWELIKYIAQRIPERLLKALPMTIAFGVGSWLIHTILLVYTNEGFNPDTWLGQNILNVKGCLISSTLLWTMVGAILPMLISFFRRGGNPFKAITSLVKMPSEIIKTNKTTGGRFLPFICFGCAAALFVEGALSGISSMVAGGIVMSSVVAFITGRGSIFIQVLRMISQDIQMYILKKQRFNLDGNSVLMIIGVSGTTLLAYGLLKTLPTPWFILMLLSYAWIVIAILGIVLLFNNNKIPKQFMFFIGLIGTAYLLSESSLLKAFADDGGWSEAGGTLGRWITSAGAIPATLSGLPPAIGALIGSYLSSILGGLFDGFGPFMGGDVVIPNQPSDPVDLTGPVPPVTGPQTTTPPQNDPTVDPKEQERIRLEQERLKQEEERQRQLKIQEQLELKRKAQEELKRIEEEKRKKQDYINQLCQKYETTPDKLREVIVAKMGENAADARKWDMAAKALQVAEISAKITLVAADTAIDGLANATGVWGKGIRAGYKVAKGIASSTAEDGFTVDNIRSGAIKGATDGLTDFTKNNYIKAGLTVGGEVAGGYITGGSDGALKGLKSGALNVVTGAVTDKISDKLGGADFGNQLKPTIFNKDGTATVVMETGGKWVSKTIAGKDAISFVDKKIGQQLTSSACKGANGLLNELVLKPALKLD